LKRNITRVNGRLDPIVHIPSAHHEFNADWEHLGFLVVASTVFTKLKADPSFLRQVAPAVKPKKKCTLEIT